MQRLHEDDSTELLLSREISPDEVLANFPQAIKALRSELSQRTPLFRDVFLRDLVRQSDWWVDPDGDLIGKGHHFSMLRLDWSPGQSDDTIMLWDRQNKRWIEHQLGLGEVHIDRDIAREEPHLGGFEPIPGDRTGMDVHGPNELTIEQVRRIVRDAIRLWSPR